MNTFIITFMVYAMCLMLVQLSYWGICFFIKCAEYVNKNRPVIIVATLGLLLSLLLLHHN